MEGKCRRSYRKSRNGCVECKRRRVKCDETHPVCQRCCRSGRHCVFAPVSVPASSPQDLGAVPPADTTAARPADVVQLRLLHHVLRCTDAVFPAMDLPGCSRGAMVDRLMAESLRHAYLLNQLLGFSARHLATLGGGGNQRGCLYRARAFQTFALEAFRGERIDAPGSDNALAVVLFSWLLGIHMLADVSAGDDALVDFLTYVDVFRGTRTVVVQAWAVMLRSEFAGVVEYGRAHATTPGDGHETGPLATLIAESVGLDAPERRACTAALATVQATIDARATDGPQAAHARCLHAVLSWPLATDAAFFVVARSHRPEALLTLAYFAVLLHWCRDFWAVGRAGRCLIDRIAAALGPGWERWLQWPQGAMLADEASNATGPTKIDQSCVDAKTSKDEQRHVSRAPEPQEWTC